MGQCLMLNQSNEKGGGGRWCLCPPVLGGALLLDRRDWFLAPDDGAGPPECSHLEVLAVSLLQSAADGGQGSAGFLLHLNTVEGLGWLLVLEGVPVLQVVGFCAESDSTARLQEFNFLARVVADDQPLQIS